MSASNLSEPNLDRSTDPWLLVVGMHRSGTSAITGALGALGFHTPHARDRAGFMPESNAEHWESLALSVYNDRLLNDLGGSWEAPPEIDLEWDSADALSRLHPPRPILHSVYPEPGPRVWKDPRLCLLLPFWKHVLPSPLVALLIWRSPLAVARSLQKRDGFHLADGLALWERYNRAAILNLAGVNTFVCSYEATLGHPARTLNAIADWLSELPQMSDSATEWHREQAANSIVRINPPGEDDAAENQLLLPQHHELIFQLASLQGGHLPLQPSLLADESDWTTALLAARNGSKTYELQIELQKTQRALDRLQASTSWVVTRPLRSVMSTLRSVRSTLSKP